MKSLPRVLFVLFVAGLIGFAIYMVYNNQNNSEQEVQIRTSEAKPQIINELRLGIAEFDTMNPILSNNRNVQDLAKIIYEPLVTLSIDYKAEPCLATEWSKMEDNGYLIKLRQGVKWHDGENFTAKDVKFTIDKIKSNEVNSIYKSNVKNVTKLDIIDNYTIRLTLDADIPFYEYNLTFPILSEKYFLEQDFLNTSKNRNPVGTGKYKVYAEEDGSLTLNKYKDYWNLKDVNEEYGIKTIHVYMYGSMGQVYNSFKIGNIDFITTNNLYVEDYIGTIGYNRKDYKGKEYDFIALNTDKPVLAHPEVRKAISFAIDKSSIITNVYNSKFYSAEFPLDYNNWLYKQNSASSGFNPAQVDTIMRENGWELRYSVWSKSENYTTRRTNLNLVVNSANSERVRAADIIKEQLASVGINISIIRATDNEYRDYLSNKNYDMIMLGTRSPLTPNVNTYLGGGNYSNYYNEELASILNEVNNISDEKILAEKYKRIYEIYHADVPFISLYFNRGTVCYSTNLMGDITPNCYNVFYNIDKWYRQY